MDLYIAHMLLSKVTHINLLYHCFSFNKPHTLQLNIKQKIPPKKVPIFLCPV